MSLPPPDVNPTDRQGRIEVQASKEVCTFFTLQEQDERIVFPLLGGKGLGLPRFCRKAAPEGACREKKIILAPLRYFLSPSLAQKGNPRAGSL